VKSLAARREADRALTQPGETLSLSGLSLPPLAAKGSMMTPRIENEDPRFPFRRFPTLYLGAAELIRYREQERRQIARRIVRAMLAHLLDAIDEEPRAKVAG
jgi:hypothetical protein